MSWVRKIAASGLLSMLEGYENELKGLREDLEELSKNRKFTIAERMAILTAYDWLNEQAVKFKFFYMSEKADRLPKEVKDKLAKVIADMDELNSWIVDTFRDYFQMPEEKFQVAL
jgi:hypothetical protein